MLRLLRAAVAAGVRPDQLGVISPYRAQVALVGRLAQQARLEGVEALTVDKCQGRDKDCVVLSLVKSNAEDHAGASSGATGRGRRAPLPAGVACGSRLRACRWRCAPCSRLHVLAAPPPLPSLPPRPPLPRQAAGRLAAHQCCHHAGQMQAGASGRRVHASLHRPVWPPGGPGAGAWLVPAATRRRAGRGVSGCPWLRKSALAWPHNTSPPIELFLNLLPFLPAAVAACDTLLVKRAALPCSGVQSQVMQFPVAGSRGSRPREASRF